MNNPNNNSQQWQILRRFLRGKFTLEDDKASQDEVMENISKGVEFKGTNLWVLIFATFVASIGLNVNSTAVIIGAMLISPLMGPIMGIGLSVGINDFVLMKKALKNFGFMVLVSILTSTLYFILSPLSTAQSELLARTSPTVWDVFIAFFGGLAGIVAQSRRDRTSTVIPGVAIATALMPPLCTAGFGLATLRFDYFIGAAYLFFINTVFIAMATYVMVRGMKYKKKQFLDPQREINVKRYMSIIAIGTLIPSVLLGIRIVNRSIFETNADRFVTSVMRFDQTQVLKYTKTFHPRQSEIEVVLIGDPVSEDALKNIKAQLPAFGLEHTELKFTHATAQNIEVDLSTIQQNMDQLLADKNQKIRDLEQRLKVLSRDTLPKVEISREISALAAQPISIALSRNIIYNYKGAPEDTLVVCLIRHFDATKMNETTRNNLTNWLRVRTGTDKVKLITE